MKCSEIAEQLESLFPMESSSSIARMILLMHNHARESFDWSDSGALLEHWQVTRAMMEAAADQHAAMTEELEGMCSEETPVRFHPDQIWMLLRSIKVQSQMLELYVPPVMV
jgi:hypothetical protein